MRLEKKKFYLSRKGDQVHISFDSEESLPVTLVWARPTTGFGKEISVIHENREVAFVEDISEFDSDSAALAKEELKKRYLIPNVTRIVDADVHLGNLYFSVDTDWGSKSFIMKNPFTSIRPFDRDGMLISDVMGNLFLVPSYSELDSRSRQVLEKVI